VIVRARGYKPTLVAGLGQRHPGEVVRATLEPLFGGVLRGKRLALDPAGGGADPGGRGPGGLRGASVNLAVARELREYLEQAGCEVTLTREGNEPISPQERVYIVNRSGAELAIGIRHETPPASIGETRVILHYPGSAGGAQCAGRLAEALAATPPGGAFAIHEWASLFLQQTSSTACEIYAGSVEDRAMESLMSDAVWPRLEAERIFAAALRYYGCDRLMPKALTVTVTENGVACPGAAVDIDHLFIRLTDAAGRAAFDCIETGTHLVTVRPKDGRIARFTENISTDGSGVLALELH
jgi:N-acetylmuramoyl-L-alanine amidase